MSSPLTPLPPLPLLPKISIVTISYNQEEFVEQTMRSVLDQGYPNLEYIVIDGASKDNSPKIIERYADRLAYYVSEPDRGPADAINKGFAHATGEIMGWINSSDILYPWALRTVGEVFRDVPEAEWITGVASQLDEGMAPQNIVKPRMNKYEYLSGRFGHIQQESTFWRRRLWDAAGGRLDTRLRHVFEQALWFRFAGLATLYHLNTLLGGFRLHGDRIEPSKKDDETRAMLWREFRDSQSVADRARGRFMRLTSSGPGVALRGILKHAGMLKWERAPRIVRDFDHKCWMAKEE